MEEHEKINYEKYPRLHIGWGWTTERHSIYAFFPTTESGGGKGASDAEFSRIEYAFTPKPQAKPIGHTTSALTKVTVLLSLVSKLEARGVQFQDGKIVASSQLWATTLLLELYRSQHMLEQPLCFEPSTKAMRNNTAKRERESDEEAEVIIKRRKPPSKEKNTAKPTGRKGSRNLLERVGSDRNIKTEGDGGQHGNSDEDDIVKPKPLSAEKLQALSADEMYEIWVHDTHKTLQAATNSMVQKKLQTALASRFGVTVDIAYIRGASKQSFNGRTPMRTSYMKHLLGSKLHGTEWDPRETNTSSNNRRSLTDIEDELEEDEMTPYAIDNARRQHSTSVGRGVPQEEQSEDANMLHAIEKANIQSVIGSKNEAMNVDTTQSNNGHGHNLEHGSYAPMSSFSTNNTGVEVPAIVNSDPGYHQFNHGIPSNIASTAQRPRNFTHNETDILGRPRPAKQVDRWLAENKNSLSSPAPDRDEKSGFSLVSSKPVNNSSSTQHFLLHTSIQEQMKPLQEDAKHGAQTFGSVAQAPPPIQHEAQVTFNNPTKYNTLQEEVFNSDMLAVGREMERVLGRKPRSDNLDWEQIEKDITQHIMFMK